jgi:hypothetical protein
VSIGIPTGCFLPGSSSRLRTRRRAAHLRMSRAKNTPLEHLYSRARGFSPTPHP